MFKYHNQSKQPVKKYPLLISHILPIINPSHTQKDLGLNAYIKYGFLYPSY